MRPPHERGGAVNVDNELSSRTTPDFREFWCFLSLKVKKYEIKYIKSCPLMDWQHLVQGDHGFQQ